MSKIYVDEILPKDNATVDGSNLSAVPASAISALNSSALPTGSVLQVVQGQTGTSTIVTTNTYTDSTLEASITPSSTSNKILVMIDIPQARKNGGTQIHARLMRDSTNIYQFQEYNLDTNDSSRLTVAICASKLDSPSTTSSITYKVQFMSSQNTSYVAMQVDNVASTMTLMEIVG